MAAETSHRNRRGFTLIELLVVVAIIALLMAILLPTLGAARDQTRAAMCRSRLKAIITAAHMYGLENRSHVPYSCFRNDDSSFFMELPFYSLASLLNTNRRGFFPSGVGSYFRGDDDIPGDPWATRINRGMVTVCPSGWMKGSLLRTVYGQATYGANAAAAPNINYDPRWTITRDWRKFEQHLNPGRLIMYGDCYEVRHRLTHGNEPRADYVHSNRWNAAFCDGHVESLPRPAPAYSSQKLPWANVER